MASHTKKIALVVAPFALAAMVCLGLGAAGFSAAREARAAARRVDATITALDVVSHWNGRVGEQVNLVRLDGPGGEHLEAVVAHHAGLRVGERVPAYVTSDVPPTVLLDAGFLNGPPVAVFLTLFGAFWALVAGGFGALLGRLASRAAQKDDPRLAQLRAVLQQVEAQAKKDTEPS